MTAPTIEPMTVPLHVDETGTIRVGGTRLLLDLVVGAFNDGASPEEIVSRYPVLRLAVAYAVIAYYLDPKQEIDAYIVEGEEKGKEWRAFWEARIPEEVKQRLRDARARLDTKAG
jgi:uncharacterized protein (DUF433 family)